MHRRRVFLLSCCIALAVAPAAQAQQTLSLDGLQLDTRDLAGSAQDLLVRAPDSSVDSLFQMFHGAMNQPQDASAICALFAPEADRSANGLSMLAQQLSPDSRERLGTALAEILIGGLQGQPQAYDRNGAERLLTANIARATLLHDGFGAGLNADADGDARCRTLRAMLDVLGQRPPAERAQVTRFLLDQGLRSATR